MLLTYAEFDEQIAEDGSIKLDGKRWERDYDAEHAPRGAYRHSGPDWPILSVGASVNPQDVPEAMADARKNGCNLNFTRDGRAIFESKSHRRQALQALGMHDRNGYG